MPYNGAGAYTLPTGYRATAGQTALASQHNTPLEDIRSALNLAFLRDGRAAMTGDLTLYRDGSSDLHAVTKQQLDSAMLEAANILPLVYGATGNNIANDNTPFATMITENPGTNVNLGGRTYYVPAGVSDEVQFYNGTIRTSSEYVSFPPTPLDHPLAGDCVVTDDSDDTHFWPGPPGQVSISSDDMILRTHVESHRHEVSIGAPVVLTRSSDGVMAGWRKVIYSNNLYEPRGLVGGMLSSVRYGVGFLLQDSSSASAGMKFVYTDDEGGTITTEDITTDPAKYFYPHGRGTVDSSGDFHIFGVQASRYVMHAVRASGGGWTVSTLKDYGAVGQIAEVASALTPSGWVFYLRDDDGSQANLYTFTATADLASTTAVIDSFIPNGLNPPQVIYEWGDIWIYVNGRRGTPIGGLEDKLIYWRAAAATVYSAGGAVSSFKGFAVACSMQENSIGYLDMCRTSSRRWIGYAIDRETANGSANPQSSRILKIGGEPAPIASPAIVRMLRRKPPITRNATFWRWSRGDTITATAGVTTMTADNWAVASSTVDATVTKTTLLGSANEVLNKILSFNPVYGLNINSAIGGSARYMIDRYYEVENVLAMSNRVVTFNMWAVGSYPASSTCFRARTIITTGAGSGGPTTVEANFQQQTMAGGATLFTVTTRTPDLTGLTLGAGCALSFQWLWNDAGAMDLTPLAAWVDFGDQHIPLDPPDYDAERAALDRRVKRLKYAGSSRVLQGRSTSTTAFEGVLAFPEMEAVPTVTMLSPTVAGDISISGTAVASAVAFSAASTQSVNVGITAGSMVADRPYWAQAHATNGFKLLLDSGR